jgi:thioredoxin-related protein
MKLFYLLLISVSFASDFKLELVARTSFVNGHNMPRASFFTNNNPAFNNKGDIAIKLQTVKGEALQGVWFNGEVKFVSKPGRYLTQVALNNKSEFVFGEFNEGRYFGVLKYDGSELKKYLKPGGPLMLMDYQSISLNDRGTMLTRSSDINGEQIIALISSEGQMKKIISQHSQIRDHFVSYLFPPALNNKDIVSVKLRYGLEGEIQNERPDVVRIFKSQTQSKIVAFDNDANETSKLLKIRNSVDVNDNNFTLIAADLSEEEALFVHDGTKLWRVATTKHRNLRVIEFFSARLNNKNNIVFRGIDGKGRRAIFFTNGRALKKVATEKQIVQTDKGPAFLYYSDEHPAFGGSPALNDKNEVVFSASLRSTVNPNVSFGSALIKAIPND